MKLTKPRTARSWCAPIVVLLAIASLAGCSGVGGITIPHIGPFASTENSSTPAASSGGTIEIPGMKGIMLPGSLPADFPSADVPIAPGDMAGGVVSTNGTEKTWIFSVVVDQSTDDAIAAAKAAYAARGFDFEDVGSQVHYWEYQDIYHYDPDIKVIALGFTNTNYKVYVNVGTDIQGGTMVSYIVDRLAT